MRYASGMSGRRLPAADGTLIQIVDAALADAARRSGEWLMCRPGCTQCCVGVFAINQLDAVRLQRGLADMKKKDPQRAQRIRERARDSMQRLSAEFPGNARNAPPSRSLPTYRSVNGAPYSPTHAWSPPSSTASPSTPTSSKPARSPTAYEPANPPLDANKPAETGGGQNPCRSVGPNHLTKRRRPRYR